MFEAQGKWMWLAALVAAATSAFAEDPKPKDAGGGFGIGPGMILVENIQPGAAEVNVFGASGLSFLAYNGTDVPQVFTLEVVKPSSVISNWEAGYEEIPDAKWCRLDKKEVEVAAKSEVKVHLFIKVPDQTKHYNRKWMAVVVCRPGKAANGAVGLQVASRVQIETVANEDLDGKKETGIGLVPSICWNDKAAPGGKIVRTLKIRNNNTDERTYALKRLSDIEPAPAKHDRYLGHGFDSTGAAYWVEPSANTLTLKAGELKELKITINVANGAKPGRKYEELLFLQDQQKQTEFVRVRMEIAALTTNNEGGAKDKTP